MATMIDFTLLNPLETAKHIAMAAKEKRLFLNLTQKNLSKRSGVSLSVIKKFEQTGKISLESLLKLSLPLGCLQDFLKLFEPKPLEDSLTLDTILKQKTRKRGHG